MSTRALAFATRTARRTGRRPRRLVASAGRVGLFSRAVIYVMLGVLAAMMAADGRPPANASSSGALAEIARQPAGPFLLGALSAGLACYAGWRIVEAITGIGSKASAPPSTWRRIGSLFIAVLYISLFAEAVSIIAGGGSGGGPSNHPQGYIARLLSAPGGPGWVGLLAAGLAVGGVALAVFALVRNHTETFDTGAMSTFERKAATATAVAGDLVRGALLLLVAGYLFFAAVTERPAEAKSLDQALESLVRQPSGPFLICLAAAGLISYALYSLFESRYRKLEPR